MSSKRELFTSPAGRAMYPKLQEPDTKFKPEGEYSVKLLLSGDLAAPILARCEEAQQAAISEEVEKKAKAGKTVKPEKVKLADLPVKPYEDPETGEETGEYVVNFKTKASGVSQSGKPWKRKPPLFDAKGQPIKGEVPPIWSGSVLKVSYSVDPFCTAIGAGCTLRIQAVQIIELRSGGDGTAEDYGFSVEADGYSYEPVNDSTDDSPFGPDPDATTESDGQEEF